MRRSLTASRRKANAIFSVPTSLPLTAAETRLVLVERTSQLSISAAKACNGDDGRAAQLRKRILDSIADSKLMDSIAG